MIHYDYILAGGGGAGLSLAYHLNYSILKDKKILIIDKDEKIKNDRTWCFWTDQPSIFDSLVHKEWERIEITGYESQYIYPLENFKYKMLRGIDFYQETLKKLNLNPNITFLKTNILQITEEKELAKVQTEQGIFSAVWVFDSRFNPKIFSPFHPKYHYLLQHFKGWQIRTTVPCFDTSKITMFDFRIKQDDGVHFFYVLPLENNLALVEYTVFSKKLLENNEYEIVLEKYIKEKLKIKDFEIEEYEQGVIPMTDYNFNRQEGKRIMNIGTKGGQARGSTGYAFLNIQRDSEAITQSLIKHGTPFYKTKTSARFRIFDALILNIMHRKGEIIADIFIQLFQKNPIERVLRFLDNKTSLLEDFKIMYSVPAMPFLKSIWNIFLTGKIRKS
ncbi:MAG: Lycopene cyclase [Bacteroidetes bacterium]|nr:MAG: Lycopene cyclase [Bacteroidota bacterium]